MCIYIYIYICIYAFVLVCIYIYIYIQREREIGLDLGHGDAVAALLAELQDTVRGALHDGEALLAFMLYVLGVVIWFVRVVYVVYSLL